MNELVPVFDFILQHMAEMPGAFTMRERINAVEASMKSHPAAAFELPLFHHFCHGVYLRELHIPKGMITIGKIHKYPCLNILAKGERSTLIGNRIERIKAPYVFSSPAGTKRISYTHEDAVWITAHATNETDIAQVEKDLVAETEGEYQDFLAAVEVERRRCLS